MQHQPDNHFISLALSMSSRILHLVTEDSASARLSLAANKLQICLVGFDYFLPMLLAIKAGDPELTQFVVAVVIVVVVVVVVVILVLPGFVVVVAAPARG